MEERLAQCRPVDFDLRQLGRFETLYDDKIARSQMPQQISQSGLRRLSQLVHQGPAFSTDEHDLACTSLAKTPRILPGPIYVKAMVGVFDQGYGQSLCPPNRQQMLYQRGFSRTGPARNTKSFHGVHNRIVCRGDTKFILPPVCFWPYRPRQTSAYHKLSPMNRRGAP